MNVLSTADSWLEPLMLLKGIEGADTESDSGKKKLLEEEVVALYRRLKLFNSAIANRLPV